MLNMLFATPAYHGNPRRPGRQPQRQPRQQQGRWHGWGRMLGVFITLSLSALLPPVASAQEVAKHIKSRHSVATTIERAQRILTHHDFRVLGIVDYAALAAEQNKQVPPARLLVFIDDQASYAAAMKGNRLFALELPLKLLVWEDDEGGVWVSYHSMAMLSAEYQLHAQTKLLAKLDTIISTLANEAAN